MNFSEATNAFALATKIINQTNKHLFLTGKAGTGKTTFLKHIVQNTHKKAVVVAPTGIAAINAGGVTIHSFFQLPFGSFIPVKQSNPLQGRFSDPSTLFKNLHINGVKRKIIQELELLIIDEVSMLRSDILDEIDLVLRFVRRKQQSSFGGVQVLFIGDLQQLPPVVKDDEWFELKKYYKSVFFFDALVLNQNKALIVELDKVFRQEDQNFITILNHLRNNQISTHDIQKLNEYYSPAFQQKKEDNYITITTHNYKADKINKDYLNELNGISYLYNAVIKGDFSEQAYPLEKTLELKVNAQIMMVKNDPNGRYYNGKIAVIHSLSEKEIKVQFPDTKEIITLEQHIWENHKYTLNQVTNDIEENVIGTFTHYPIKLAWAITVHKSQGLTFDKAIIDIGSVFAAGQAYVALSRLRSLNGLVLTSKINEGAIEYDKNIALFSENKKSEEELKQIAQEESQAFFKSYLLNCFDLSGLLNTLQSHVDSYYKDKNKSTKQTHKQWAMLLRDQLEKELVHSQKFIQYVHGVLDKKANDFLSTLHQRVAAAEGYFTPIVKTLSTKILQHIELVKSEKKMKIYLSELLELESACNEQIKKFKKAILFCQSIIDKTEFTKDKISHLNRDDERLKQISSSLQTNTYLKNKERIKVEKKEKIPTRDYTLQLYKEGKSIELIAKERSFGVTTIEGHLCDLIREGKLEAKEFVNEKIIDSILEIVRKINSFQLGVIKENVGDQFTYREIKFALASMK